MEIEFQYSKEDFIKFFKSYYRYLAIKRAWLIAIFVLIAFSTFSANPFSWKTFVIGMAASLLFIVALFYYVPLVISIIKINKLLEGDKSVLEKRKVSITPEGLSTVSESATSIRKWESMRNAFVISGFVIIELVDKRPFLIPNRAFQSESEATNFLGLLQNNIFKSRGLPNLQPMPKKPNYALGFICLVPVVGAVVGLIMIVNGISRYKDKWLVLIGMGGLLVTAFFYYTAFYTDVFGFKKFDIEISQRQLNTLIKDVEFYKIQHGVYPDSLEQLEKDNSNIFIYDPLKTSGKVKKSDEFNYQKAGNHYYLFSSGPDHIPNTADDIYPQLPASDSSKVGLIINKTR